MIDMRRPCARRSSFDDNLIATAQDAGLPEDVESFRAECRRSVVGDVGATVKDDPIQTWIRARISMQVSFGAASSMVAAHRAFLSSENLLGIVTTTRYNGPTLVTVVDRGDPGAVGEPAEERLLIAGLDHLERLQPLEEAAVMGVGLLEGRLRPADGEQHGPHPRCCDTRLREPRGER